ncbi:hypothetical protein ACLOJK_018829 [Asimina triloba]
MLAIVRFARVDGRSSDCCRLIQMGFVTPATGDICPSDLKKASCCDRMSHRFCRALPPAFCWDSSHVQIYNFELLPGRCLLACWLDGFVHGDGFQFGRLQICNSSWGSRRDGRGPHRCDLAPWVGRCSSVHCYWIEQGIMKDSGLDC